MDSGLVYGCLTPHPPIIVPAVGGRRVGQVSSTRAAMSVVASDIRSAAPDVVVLISPHAPISPGSMGVCTALAYSGGFEAFGASGVGLSADGDPDLAAAILSACRSTGVPAHAIAGHRGEQLLDHGAAVPLYFLTEAAVKCRLVLLSFCALDVAAHRHFGEAVAAAVASLGRRAALVASGDLSHRLKPGAPAGYSPMGARFDGAVVAALRAADRDAIFEMDEGLRDSAGECGYRSLVIALAALPSAVPEVLSYEGPFGVGYLVARFRVDAVRGGRHADTASAVETDALALARSAVETYVRTGRMIVAPVRPRGFLGLSAGVFVSLKSGGELRGCIGTFMPTERNVAEEIVRNAVASATRDPRFPPVSEEELPCLSYSIDILSRPEPVEEESQLDPIRYGVIVQSGARRGLLLPDLDTVTTVRAQLDIARGKAGIASSESVKISRFTVRRISE